MIIVLDNIRSLHNVGSIIRLAAFFGVNSVYTVGITPHLSTAGDTRLPHIVRKADAKIKKTSLGGEDYVDLKHFDEMGSTIKSLKSRKYVVVGLEQATTSVNLNELTIDSKNVALILGNEVDGINAETLKQCDYIAEIFGQGKKNSLNVSTAAAIAINQLAEKLSTSI